MWCFANTLWSFALLEKVPNTKNEMLSLGGILIGHTIQQREPYHKTPNKDKFLRKLPCLSLLMRSDCGGFMPMNES